MKSCRIQKELRDLEHGMDKVKHIARVEIYGLYDPNTYELRYIGKANDSNKRLASHLRDAKRRDYPVYRWINKLLSKSQLPIMKVLLVTDSESWKEDEKRIIKETRESGVKLLNVAEGGDEPFCDIETRRKNGIKNTSNLTGYLSKVKKSIVTDLNIVLKYNGIKAVHEWIERVEPKIKNNNQKIVINYLKEKYSYEIRQ